jgi:hypothetical protein
MPYRKQERFILLIVVLALFVAVRWVRLTFGGDPGGFNDFSPFIVLLCATAALLAYVGMGLLRGKPFWITRWITLLWAVLMAFALAVCIYQHSGRADEDRTQREAAAQREERARLSNPQIESVIKMIEARRRRRDASTTAP